MKKAIILFVAVALTGTFTARAQGGGGFQRRTVEERVKNVMDKLADLKLDKDQTEKTSAVFTDFFKEQNKVRQEMMGGGNPPDRTQMREKMQKLISDRDEKLKKIFSEDQYKKWKDEIEPAMRPQRRGGGGNN